MQTKMVFKICERISCSSFYVNEFDVIKTFSLYNPIKFLAILYPKSLANLLVEVGTRHSHQILFMGLLRKVCKKGVYEAPFKVYVPSGHMTW